MSEPTEDLDFVIDLLPSGRIKFNIDGTIYTWRGAKLGELKEIDSFGAKFIEDNPQATVVDLRIAQWTMMFELLSDVPLPDADNLPGGFVNVETLNTVKGHLWAVPLVRSAPAQEAVVV